MSLRIVKSGIKKVNKQDALIREMRDNIYNDELNRDVGYGNSILRDYLPHELKLGRVLYSRVRKHFDRLTKRQQKRIVYKAQAYRDKRKVTDKLTAI